MSCPLKDLSLIHILEAKVSGRNDILLANGTKVCGNAFYHLKNRNIVHGTMLYDTNYNRMTRALTPDRLKLESAGVKSVKSRTGLIKEVLEIGVYGLSLIHISLPATLPNSEQKRFTHNTQGMLRDFRSASQKK